MSNNDQFLPFPYAVSIEPWISEFDAHGKATVHAEVSFGTERVGGAEDAQVQFRLSLKRAEVVVTVPASEPLTVLPSSVARDGGAVVLKRSVVSEREATSTFEANLSSEAGFDSQSGKPQIKSKGGLGVSAKNQNTQKTRTEMEDNTGPLGWRWLRSQAGEYVWLVWPKASNILVGRPWDGAGEPRVGVEAQDGAYRSYLPLTVFVEVRCLYEDVDIQDIRLKDVGLWDRLRGQAGYPARRAAAEAFLRDKITQGLRPNPFTPFVGLTFARARCHRE